MREGNETWDWGEPLTQKVSEEKFCLIWFSTEEKKMGKRETEKWKEAPKADIVKNSSLLHFFHQIYWANKNAYLQFYLGKHVASEKKNPKEQI